MASYTSPVGVLRLIKLLATAPLFCGTLALGQSTQPQAAPVPTFFPVPLNNSNAPISTSDDPAANPVPGKPSPNLRIVDNDPVYKYIGCYSETTFSTPRSRALDGPYYTVPGSMTVEACFTFCSHARNGNRSNDEGWRYAGLEFSRECWCGDRLNSHSYHLIDAVCDTPCDGANTTVCGGHLALTLYNTTEKSDDNGNSTDGIPGIGGGDDSNPQGDEAALQAVGVGFLVLAVTFAFAFGCM
ncbi:WSC domain-containing protein [Hypomontagnella submonticulosa]|nr:WSC domain-containing protein [Hypomontagnella submonticulosa]